MIYNITDSSDGKLLLTIEVGVPLPELLKHIKATTEKLWYAASSDGLDTLTTEETEIIDTTVNGDWVEIFEVLLKQNKIGYEIINIEEI